MVPLRVASLLLQRESCISALVSKLNFSLSQQDMLTLTIMSFFGRICAIKWYESTLEAASSLTTTTGSASTLVIAPLSSFLGAWHLWLDGDFSNH